MGIMLRSPPLVIGFIIWCIVGGAYSIDVSTQLASIHNIVICEKKKKKNPNQKLQLEMKIMKSI